MLKYRQNIDNSKNLLNYNECTKLIKNHEFIKKGEGAVGDIYKVVSKDCGCVVIKIFKSEYTMKKECLIQYKVKQFIDKNICGNFIDIFECNYDNKYIIMEYADDDSYHLFDELNTLNDESNTNIIFSFIIQILIGLLCFQKKLNLFHGDYAFRNILYKKISPIVNLHYEINSEHFYIPTFGYLFLIIDFGSYRKIKNSKFNFDIFDKFNSLNSDLEKLLIRKILYNYNQDDFINIFLPKHKVFIDEIYNTDKKIYMKNIRHYIKNLKFNDIILNYDELIKKGINKNIIYIKKIIDTTPDIFDLIQKIYKQSKFTKTNNNMTTNFIMTC